MDKSRLDPDLMRAAASELEKFAVAFRLAADQVPTPERVHETLSPVLLGLGPLRERVERQWFAAQSSTSQRTE
ncbi:hypothetical protein [Crossiella cryophila]|uniref:Uncharacterized protein n=1 Tax=Crossiella cryophila TaxID=43355 RepID=A0A7W7CE41_9PSEU|nr:hypothetical protein [Crossiella cryophila]MBB4679495.1 hypothetical protein [Crossiella cryophila]